MQPPLDKVSVDDQALDVHVELFFVLLNVKSIFDVVLLVDVLDEFL